MTKENTEKSDKSKMLTGSTWMTAGSIFSRILGALYIIPWNIWFTEKYYNQANALYVQGYNVYATLLIIAIAGIPSAIAKEVAHYNALNEYGVGVKLYKKGLFLSAIIGFLCAIFFFLGAPLFDNGNSQVIPIMHSLAPAVLIIPAMGVTRGFFQGYQDMAPSAISQFAEQVVRVIYMLGAVFLIMQVLHGNYVSAVSQSTFAAFIGALSGFAILGWYYFIHRKYYRNLVAHSNNKVKVPTKRLYHEIIRQSLPFVFLGAGTSIFQLIDQYTFFYIMRKVTKYTNVDINNLYSIFAGNASKLIMITISLSSAIAVTVVPLLSKAYTKKNKQEVRQQVNEALVLFALVMFPSALGMTAIAGPLNRIFYGTFEAGFSANVLSLYSLVAITYGIFTVVTAMMQGINENKKAVKLFCVGILAKLLTQFPLVAWLGDFGAILTSAIGFLVTSWLILRSMSKQFNLHYRQIAHSINEVMAYSILTYLSALITTLVMNHVVSLIYNPDGRIGSLIVVIFAVIIGGIVYGSCLLHSKLSERVFGKTIMEKIRNKIPL